MYPQVKLPQTAAVVLLEVPLHVTKALQRQNPFAQLGLSDEEIFYIAGSALIARTDTGSITLLWFVMAMALYPETMTKAQREIDAIRKGITVMPSIWHMHHNEEEFPDSYTFDPERFLSKTDGTAAGDGSLAEGHYEFGFGRRVDPDHWRKFPGQHMATKSTWISIVRVLWAFNIETRQDAAGNPMKIDPEDCTSGLTV
ncbi:cytochrome P450 [Mycena olivaceomarginata]|nr:cytochrome P450 [Mycena olivaceomarginata]